MENDESKRYENGTLTEMGTTQIQKNKKTFPISVNKIFILQISAYHNNFV